MKNNQNAIPFNEYIDLLNNYNNDITLNGDTYPKTNLTKIEKQKRKELIYANLKARLINLLCRLYKWKLPDNFEERTIELGFIYYGMIACFKADEGTFILPCIPYNKYNIYGNPVQVNVHGWNGYHKVVDVLYGADIPSEINIPNDYTTAKGVICRDNPLAYPYIRYVREYAWKLADKIIALEIATQRLKSPFIYIVNDINLKDNFERLIEKIESNDDIIFKIKSNKLIKFEDAIQPISVNINPAIIQAIKDSINFDFNMFLETVGVNTNPSPDKSQVVLTPEIDSNDELVQIEKNLRFEERKKFCDKVKKLLGVKISCEPNETEIQKEVSKIKKELSNGEKVDTNRTETKTE